MNKKAQIFLLITTIIGTNFYSSLHAELLILKKTEAGFAPLDDSDAPHRKTIEDILLKYQWPMSSALALERFTTRNELLETTGDLFTADKPNAEELFIEQEIQKQTGNSSYRVIFFPTTLYELFVIFETFNSYSQNNPLQNALYNVNVAKKIDLEPIFSKHDDPRIVLPLIKDSFEEFNNLFFNEETSAHHYINSTLVRKILSLYPDLETSADSLKFAHSIKEKNEELLLTLLGDLAHLFKTTGVDTCLTGKFATPYKKIEALTQPEQQKIFKKIIPLEYQARDLNKGLLLRGTSFEEFSPFAIHEDTNPTLLAGLPVLLTQEFSRRKRYPMEKAYAQKTNTPYSISFGNSLLGGIFLDYGACAYNYLTQTKELPGAGYGLFIDKRQYIDNNNGGLFFISPLSNLAALYAQGEFFHSRSKAATPIKKEESSYGNGSIVGLGSRMADKIGVFLITRDPLKHGALFSQFLAENGTIIQMAENEVEGFQEDILQAQQKAAKYLEAIQVLAPAIKKFEKKFRDEHPSL